MQWQLGISLVEPCSTLHSALGHNAMFEVFDAASTRSSRESRYPPVSPLLTPRISFRPDFISLLTDDKAECCAQRKEKEETHHRDCAGGYPRRRGWRKPMAARARESAVGALGLAAVWKNCSSFATVFRSSVPSTVFHAPLCFPKPPPPPRAHQTAFIPRVCPRVRARAREGERKREKEGKRAPAIRRTFRYYRFSANEQRQRRPSRSPEKASSSRAYRVASVVTDE